MDGVITLIAGLFGLGIFAALGVVAELFDDVRQLRELSGISDRPLHIELGEVAGTKPSDYGFPGAWDQYEGGYLLFLSDSCGTCKALALSFAGRVPEGLALITEARDAPSAHAFLHSVGLADTLDSPRVLIDEGRVLATRLGLDTTPVAFALEQGRFVGACMVPSTRVLKTLLSKPRRRAPTSPLSQEGPRRSECMNLETPRTMDARVHT